MSKIPPELAVHYKGFFASIFYDILMGVLINDQTEAEFRELKLKMQRFTDSQVKALADCASGYYVDHINPSTQNDKRAIHALKARYEAPTSKKTCPRIFPAGTQRAKETPIPRKSIGCQCSICRRVPV
jgi:hypothetical protein